MESAIDLIQVARQIDMESEEVVQLARTMSEACTDKRLKRVISYSWSQIAYNVCDHDRFYLKLWTRSPARLLS